MPILIAGTVNVAPEQRDAALRAGRPHMEATRAQRGCIHYQWGADPLEPGRIYVYEEWESQEALAAHFAGPHYRNMRECIGAHGLISAEVSKFRVNLQEPVYDETGTPRADFFSEGADS